MEKLDKILKSARVQEWQQLVKEGHSLLVEGLWDAPKALLIALAQKVSGKHILILTGGTQEAMRLYHDFPLFTTYPIEEFPAWETLPHEQISPSPDIVGERYRLLRGLLETKEPYILLSSWHACLQRLIPPDQFQQLHLCLKTGEEVAFQTLIEQLEAMGYSRRPVASDKGEFAIRGGIVDIFPVSSPDPYRLEFFGDQIESMRIYDPTGQKSVRPATQLQITPAQELELLAKQKRLSTLFDYIKEKTIVVFDDLLELEDRYATLVGRITGSSGNFCSMEEFLKLIDPLQKIYLTPTPLDQLSEVKVTGHKNQRYYSSTAPAEEVTFEMFNRPLRADRFHSPFIPVVEYLAPGQKNNPEEAPSGDELLSRLALLAKEEISLTFLSSSETEENSLKAKIAQQSIALPNHHQWARGYLSSGFALSDTPFLLFPYTEITHKHLLRRQKLRSTYHTTPLEVYDLSPGENVVHLNHGIGRFLGLEKKLNNNQIESEFFHIEYADKARLFVPIQQAHLLSKYVGAKDEVPTFHTLGGTRWKKTREQTEQAIKGYAKDLLNIYAHRTLKGGFCYPEDSQEMRDFEDEFPFVETEDQVRAIADLKADMQSSKSMDRLVCGDVGYGKTEVAMRAAFKAVVDGRKQVAVLVPTTVLAMQHYENFSERMANFPVKVGVLSRFRTSKETKETLAGIANGSVDIVIGTHRVVSQDVHFKELGLVIIDEEQRFGVKAKEHLKKIKAGVDCLTLSATPIPRTLYMSLVGVRDMSVISTPPQDRLPIKSIIAEAEDELIKNALIRELGRDGQAFIIHNRVETIHEYASHIQKLLPQARIVVGHGQMSAEEIDSVFHAFKKGDANILISTTIIENGIDIPLANTIIIDRADRFGLADLYQLRGRVGRWNRRAYAYFLVPKFRASSELVCKRLEALASASGCGGGMKVAMRDLEIRGAGDMLGMEQSGHVSAIGFHLYCKMLKRTVEALQGKMPENLIETKIEFPFDARLPEEYVNEASLRMELYQRFGDALSWEELDNLWNEVKDRFGPPPLPAKWLYHVTRTKVWASRNSFTLLKIAGTLLTAEKHTDKEKASFKEELGKITSPQGVEEKVIPILKKWNSLFVKKVH